MVVTTEGKNQLRILLLSDMFDSFKYFGVGTSDTEEDSNQTDLISPLEIRVGSGIYRKEVDNIYWDGTNIVFVCRLRQGEFNSSSGDIYIKEIGIFNTIQGGTMLIRSVLSQQLLKNQDKEYVIEVKMNLFG